jgi:predicted dehydrogenase
MLNVDYAYGPLLGEHYIGAIYHQIAHFVDCALHKHTPLVRTDTAHLAVRVVAAAQESVRTGSPVHLS